MQGHDPLTFLSCRPFFFFLIGWEFYGPEVLKLARVQELCESRGGRPGLSILMSLTVSVDVKQH